MKNREIKFRAWDNVDYMSGTFTLKDLQDKKIGFTDECIVMQFTGLQDKNGVDIYFGDTIPLKMKSEVNNFKECSYIDTDSYGNKTYKKIKLVNTTICFEDGEIVFKYKDITKSLWVAKVDRENWEVTGNIHQS